MRIAVDADDMAGRRGQQRARIAARSEGAVDIDAARARGESLAGIIEGVAREVTRAEAA